MGACSFTITPLTTSTAISFPALTFSAGRYALNIQPASSVYAMDQKHPNGVDGNYIVNHGRVGQMLTVDVLYLNAASLAMGAYRTDIAAIAGDFCTIVDGIANATYSRMRLVDDFKIISIKPLASVQFTAEQAIIITARATFNRE